LAEWLVLKIFGVRVATRMTGRTLHLRD